jgi:competence protein ComEC
MLKAGLPLASEIIKVAHHGSNSSSTSAFLNAVRPAVAVISVGDNSYGLPRSEALLRLAEVGAYIYRTDYAGTIIVATDGNTYHIAPSRYLYMYLPAVSQ